MRKKNFYKSDYFRTILIFILGFFLGVFSIWPGIISETSRNCFSSILKDGSDGNVKLNTLLKINPNYLLQIKNKKNIYFKILLIGDSCFRSF